MIRFRLVPSPPPIRRRYCRVCRLELPATAAPGHRLCRTCFRWCSAGAALRRAALALQQRELALMRERPPGSVDQLEMSRMTKSIRDIQAMGRLSIGETTESRQTEFDFVVRYEQTANPPVHA